MSIKHTQYQTGGEEQHHEEPYEHQPSGQHLFTGL